MKMFSDNKISFILIKNLEIKNYIKYIDVIHYHIYGLIKNKKLVIK